MRILLADHHILFREGLIGLLSRDPEIEVVETTSLARETIEKTEALKPDILLLEMDLPDGSGLDVLKTIYNRCPDVNVVILSMQMTDDLLLACVENGGKGYLMKDIPVNQLIKSLKGVMRNETAFSRATFRRLVDRLAHENHRPHQLSAFDLLTNREVEVLELICLGASNIEIANSLKISENTAKAHVRKILEKLNIRNRREARNLAIRSGFPEARKSNGVRPPLEPAFKIEKK
jgi:DNA-binding NarL/FixJ family response regulator